VTLSDAARRLRYLSHCWVGKTHDYRMFQEEFPPEQNWFADFCVRVDLGFLGFAQDYVCKELYIPHKKSQKQELTPTQKEENKLLASKRIVVEHAIAGMKRYRILVDRLRMHDLKLYDDILGVCAGLWNFHLSC
jgi:hypothetical protein